jgi:hypothetical protein
MTLKEATKHALTILKQVMEEKLNSTNIEVRGFLSNFSEKNVNFNFKFFSRCQ